MDETIYVKVNWNEKDNRVEVDPSSIELTDGVGWVCWSSDGTGPEGVNPRPDVTVSFQGAQKHGPFKKLASEHGTMWGSGNWGPRPRAKTPRYSYKVVLHSPDGPKSGSGLVINRATKPKPAKLRKHPTNPTQPSGPPDITLKRSGTAVSLDPQLFQMPEGKPYVVWGFSEGITPKRITFPAATGKPFERLEILPFKCVGNVASKGLERGSSFDYEIEIEELAEPVKGVIRLT